VKSSRNRFLNIGMTLATLKKSGKIPLLNELFITVQRGFEIMFGTSLRRNVGMLLGPRLFSVLSVFVMRPDISFSVTGLIKNDLAFGMLRKSLKTRLGGIALLSNLLCIVLK
jgi:hypothetical protein